VSYIITDWRSIVKAEMEMGHGSWVKWSPFLDGSCRSWVTASDPLTHHDEITAQ